MSANWRCRSCATELRGAAHLRLPSSLKGLSGLCLTCTDRLMEKYHCHATHDFVPRYLKDQREETPLNALREEVRQLRALLDEVTKPDT